MVIELHTKKGDWRKENHVLSKKSVPPPTPTNFPGFNTVEEYLVDGNTASAVVAEVTQLHVNAAMQRSRVPWQQRRRYGFKASVS